MLDLRWSRKARVGAIAALGLAIASAPAAWAGDPSSSGDLQSEVSTLQTEVQELQGELKMMKAQQTVAMPPTPAGATAPAPPDTIGQHVASVENNVSTIQKNIATNLGVNIHGLVDTEFGYNINRPDTTGYTHGGINSFSTGGSTNQLRVFDVNATGFTLQQFNFHMDKEADGGVGFVSDINFGQTANILRASTRWSNINPGPVSNDVVDPTQAYLTYTVPVGSGINLSAGRFVTLMGEEVIPVYNNQNFNESRGFVFGFGEALTHTGLRAQYTINPQWSVTTGVNNGWDDVSSNDDGQNVEGQIAFNPNAAWSFVVNGTYGPNQINQGGSKRGLIDPIVTWHTPLTGLQLIGEYIYGSESGPVSIVPLTVSGVNPLSGQTPGPDGTVMSEHGVHWQGAAGYVVYDFNDYWESATRGEWFDDPNGARTGLPQTLGEITEDINFKVPQVSGLLTRLEYRHDMSGQRPFFSSDGFVTGPGGVPTTTPLHTYSGQDTILAAIIYSF